MLDDSLKNRPNWPSGNARRLVITMTAGAMLLVASGCQTPPGSVTEGFDSQAIVDEFKRYGLTATRTDRGVVVYLRNIFFGFDKFVLTDAAEGKLKELAVVLTGAAAGHLPVAVEGHTDSIGTTSYNARLSEARAQTVASYLIERGVGAKRLTVAGFGEARPIAANRKPNGRDDPEGRARNRRVEVVIERIEEKGHE